MLKSIPYFSVKKFKIISKDTQIENLIQREFGLNVSQEEPFDLIYLDHVQADVLAIYKNKIHNDSMVIIGNIHKDKEATIIWKMVRQNEMITASLDLFYCGILFFRQEQVKEHFKIRI